MENEEKTRSGAGGVIVGVLGLLVAAGALVVGRQQHRQSQDEIEKLRGQVAQLTETSGKLGIVEERVNWLQVKTDELAEKGVQAQQFTNLVEDFRVARSGLVPMIERLDTINSGTNIPHVLRQQTELLAVLEARLATYEAKPEPYLPEELALLQLRSAGLRKVDLKKLSELNTLAQNAYADGRHADAEKHYVEMLQINPKDHLTVANLATVQMELNKFEDAERNLQRVLLNHPKDAKSVALLGLVKLRRADLNGAMVQLARATELDPKNAETHNYLGIVLSQKGQRKAAETAFRRALKLEPNYAIAHFNLAVHYVTAKPPAGGLAKWHYEKAIRAGHPRQARVEKMLQEAL